MMRQSAFILVLVLLPLTFAASASGGDPFYMAVTDRAGGRMALFDGNDGSYQGDLPFEQPFVQGAVSMLRAPGNRYLVLIPGIGGVRMFAGDYEYAGMYCDASDGIGGVSGMAWRGNHLYVACSTGYVARFSGPHRRETDFIVTGGSPTDIAFLPDGRALVSDSAAGGRILVYEADGTYSHQVLAVSEPQQLAADPQLPGAWLNAAHGGSGQVTDFDVDGSVAGSFAFTAAYGARRLGNGNLLVANDSGVFELDGQTGAFVEFELPGMAGGHVDDFRPSTILIFTGPGEGPGNVSDIHAYWAPGTDPLWTIDAYGVDRYGVNVALGNLDVDIQPELISGAGPGAVFGPHVRGFDVEGQPLPDLSFLAYGTSKYGVNVAAGDLDGDGYDEIVTGAGPGAVFGPHVRGWNVDNGAPAPMAGVSFFAYGTPKWGVNVAAGDIDGDDRDEIVTGAGPGAVYGAHVRGFDVDGGSAAPVPGVSYFAYGTPQYGVNVCCTDIDTDGIDEIITAPGPGPAFRMHIRGWNYDGVALEAMDGINFLLAQHLPWYFGATVGGAEGNSLSDGLPMFCVGLGPGPGNEPYLFVMTYDGAGVDALLSGETYPGQQVTHGVNGVISWY